MMLVTVVATHICVAESDAYAGCDILIKAKSGKLAVFFDPKHSKVKTSGGTYKKIFKSKKLIRINRTHRTVYKATFGCNVLRQWKFRLVANPGQPNRRQEKTVYVPADRNRPGWTKAMKIDLKNVSRHFTDD